MEKNNITWENPIPEEKKGTEALEFYDTVDKSKEQAIYTFNTGNKNEICIDKNNKNAVKGNQLYVLYKGISIFANLTECILINTQTDVIMIKPYKEVTAPEDKEYLILLSYIDSEENTFQEVTGRQEAFNFIKDMVDYIDLEKSKILVETVSLANAINVYDFMKNCIDHECVDNSTGFDIDDYGDYFKSVEEE